MKKKNFQMEISTPKSFMLLFTALSLGFISFLSGCVTSAALLLAGEKSRPVITYTEWNISMVKSAVEQENGDISVCIEFFESDKANQSEYYVINMPGPSLLKETTDLETIGLREKKVAGHPDGDSPDPNIHHYLYPLAKAEKGCHKLEPSKFPADSKIPLVKLTLPEKERYRLYTFLDELKLQGSPEKKLYEIKFLNAKEDSDVEMNDTKVTEYSDVMLIYWPSDADQEIVYPLVLAGGYESEDESTNFYYLLVPPAVMIDLFVLGVQGGRV